MLAHSLLADLFRLVKIEQERDAVARVYDNRPPLNSYAHECGETDVDPVIKRKKRALHKSWPELAEALDRLMEDYVP
jgi:hypothetical protein